MDEQKFKVGDRVVCVWLDERTIERTGKKAMVTHVGFPFIMVKWDDDYKDHLTWVPGNKFEVFRFAQDCKSITSKEQFIDSILNK